MLCSPHKRSLLKPNQCASSTIAIRPEMRVVKQLDYGIADTFVSSVLEGASFALIVFRLAGWRKAVCLRHQHKVVDTKVWAIPSSNCAARFVLAEWPRGKSNGDYERTRQTHTDEHTCETRT